MLFLITSSRQGTTFSLQDPGLIYTTQHRVRIAEKRTLMFQKEFLYSPFMISAQKTMISAQKYEKKLKTKNNTKRALGAFNQEL